MDGLARRSLNLSQHRCRVPGFQFGCTRLLPRGLAHGGRLHPTLAAERGHPYLWRFWRQLPRLGRATIYDRSWYGRVLVERVEGYCAKEDWTRAYSEIVEFEAEDKRWARLRVMKAVADRLEDELG